MSIQFDNNIISFLEYKIEKEMNEFPRVIVREKLTFTSDDFEGCDAFDCYNYNHEVYREISILKKKFSGLEEKNFYRVKIYQKVSFILLLLLLLQGFIK